MHLYNAWLPPMVAEETKKEAESFASVVRSVKGSWRPDDPDSVYDTLKWIPIIDLFLRAKSDISPGDVKDLVEFGLKLFHASQGKLYPQVRWGLILITLLKKHGKKLSIGIHWRPFYDNLMLTHFKRNTGPEGWRLKQKHIKTVTSLVQSCRKFFPAGSASEIWSEFRYSLAVLFFLLVKDIKLQRTLKVRPSDVQGMYLACVADDYTGPENSKY